MHPYVCYIRVYIHNIYVCLLQTNVSFSCCSRRISTPPVQAGIAAKTSQWPACLKTPEYIGYFGHTSQLHVFGKESPISPGKSSYHMKRARNRTSGDVLLGANFRQAKIAKSRSCCSPLVTQQLVARYSTHHVGGGGGCEARTGRKDTALGGATTPGVFEAIATSNR